ncbi:hypothetical protein Pmani_033718 [Petrolisthes manimaculis]|uniref:Uncharacterized protein n=1 Tax=Petrolisthes manimaculis TaxID=1843537 RepID=A0AAE1NP62_9EUCA|nr:hypothetical protein Pmani_033718 [Petrolisthes manimaculis]
MKDKDQIAMLREEKRLETFKKWPFNSNTNISKEKMAVAGFYFIGNKKEPDLVKCFICQKELDGWEEEDSAWEEHKKHASYCQFIQLNKSSSEITMQDVQDLDMHRMMNITKQVLSKKIEEFKKQAEKTRELLENCV